MLVNPLPNPELKPLLAKLIGRTTGKACCGFTWSSFSSLRALWPKGISFLLAHKGRKIRSRQRLRNVTASMRNPALYQSHPFSPL
ncbi:hypothetical protein SRHO_G00052620 [Serrasalmus rhombeus]